MQDETFDHNFLPENAIPWLSELCTTEIRFSEIVYDKFNRLCDMASAIGWVFFISIWINDFLSTVRFYYLVIYS